MIFSDKDIRSAIASGRITIDPYEPSLIQPASIDLRLGKKFLIFKNAKHYVIDVKKPIDEMMEEIELEKGRPFILHPGEFALGITYERIGVAPDMVGRLEGKSSLGRIGIIIHATAGYLDPGNCLRMTLELHNIGNLPVMLYHKMPIAQMAFSPLTSPCEVPYGAQKGSKYYNVDIPQASQMYKNFVKKEFQEDEN